MPGTEKLIGYFVNTLPMFVSLSGSGSAGDVDSGSSDGDELVVSELMRRVRTSVLGAFSHSDVPFTRIKDALAVQHDACCAKRGPLSPTNRKNAMARKRHTTHRDPSPNNSGALALAGGKNDAEGA